MDPYFIFHQHLHVIALMLVFIIVPSLLLLIKRKNVAVGRRKLPPGPFRLPFIGNLHQLRDLPHRSFQVLSAKYGPLMFLQLGSVPTLVISSADVVSEIFKSHDPVFSNKPVMYAAKKLSYGCLDIAFAPYDECWKEIRKIAMLELFSARKVQSFETVRKEELAHTMDFIASSSDGLVNLSETLLHLINDIVCRVSFGRKFDENSGRSGFHALLQDTEDLLGGFCVADFYPWLGWIHRLDGLDAKLNNIFQKMDTIYDDVIGEHLNAYRRETESEDLVDVMLRLQRDQSSKTALSTGRIKAVLMNMFVAGTNSSSATLVWTMTELIKNPILINKAQEELNEVVGKKKAVEESDIPRLNYLKLVVKEALRLHPPAPLLLPRETTESCTIQGYHIPEKTRVFVNAKVVATDPRSWKNPEQFWPERFLDNPIDFKGLDYEYIPFGVGRRGCPGMSFAVVLIELVLANLLHCFNWELPQEVQREDLDMQEAFGVTMHKKVPLRLIARKRKTV